MGALGTMLLFAALSAACSGERPAPAAADEFTGIGRPGGFEKRAEAGGASALGIDEMGRADEGGVVSSVGEYLAGRHAQSIHDLSAAADYFAEALRADPQEPQLMLHTLLLLASEGRIAEAADLAQRLLDSGTEVSAARLVLAAHEGRTGDFEAAYRQVTRLPEEGLNVYLLPLLSSWALAGAGKRREALAALEDLPDEGVLGSVRHFHGGLILDLFGASEEAEESLRKAAESLGEPPFRLADALGRLYERQGRVEEARDLYEAYQAQNPDSELFAFSRARLAAGEKPKPRVESATEGLGEAMFDAASMLRREATKEIPIAIARMALHLKPDFPEATMFVAEILEGLGRHREAIDAYETVATDSPFKPFARLRTAVNLDAVGETDHATAMLEEMAGEGADGTGALIQLGDMLRSRERFEKAAAVYDRAIARIGKMERRHWPLLYARGIALQRAEQWPRAEADFLSALELDPDQPHVLNYLGYSWAEKGIHLTKSREMIERAVELRPNDGYIVDSLGWVLYQSGEFEGAVRHLERAVELMPEDATINDHLGDAYWRVGRRYEARFQWSRALHFAPEPELATAIEAKLERGLAEETNAGKGG